MTRNDPLGFGKCINTDAIRNLTPEQRAEVMAILANVPGAKRKRGAK